MPQAQLNALLAVAHQLPAITQELRKANKLKALELRLKIQYEWRPSTAVEDLKELSRISEKDN